MIIVYDFVDACLSYIFFGFAITRNLVLLTSIFFKKSSIFRCFLMKLVLNSFVVLFILLKNEICFSHAENKWNFYSYFAPEYNFAEYLEQNRWQAQIKTYFNYCIQWLKVYFISSEFQYVVTALFLIQVSPFITTNPF